MDGGGTSGAWKAAVVPYVGYRGIVRWNRPGTKRKPLGQHNPVPAVEPLVVPVVPPDHLSPSQDQMSAIRREEEGAQKQERNNTLGEPNTKSKERKRENNTRTTRLTPTPRREDGGRGHLCLSQLVWHREELSLGP